MLPLGPTASILPTEDLTRQNLLRIWIRTYY